ncbi:MAG TPA: HEAT repeat domain-containing protein [Longimicrobiaceae bacterium]|nr:HEAT repeat domain-containing protein [Longimicrobiaceae bacterium]
MTLLTFSRAIALVSAICIVAGCGAALREPQRVAQPYSLTDAEVSAYAVLLRMEDRREYNARQLSEFASAPSAAIRRRAALVLGRLGDTAAVPILVGLTTDPDSSVAATAAFSLGELGDSAAVPALSSLLLEGVADTTPTVAVEAATALGKIGTQEAEAALMGVLSDFSVDSPTSSDLVNAALLAIWKFPRPIDLDAITRWAESSDAETRWRTVYALVRRPSPPAAHILLDGIGDPNSRVRAIAAKGLTAALADSAGLDRTAVMDLLIDATEDTAYSVRINAAGALGSYSAPASVASLMALARGADPHLRLTAIESLGRVGEDAVASRDLLASLVVSDSISPAIRASSLAALGEIAPGDARERAIAVVDDAEWRIRAAAANVLAKVGTIEDPALNELLQADDGRVAAAAAGAIIAAAGDSLASLRHMLVGLLGNDDVIVRAVALGGLARLDDPALLPLFLDAYEHARLESQNDAALAAIDALSSLQDEGPNAERAFFARFPRSPDPLIRRRVQDHFGELPETWGSVRPLETDRSLAQYKKIVREWIAPAFSTGERPRARIQTNRGPLDFELFVESALLTVLNFLSLADQDYFDGQEWPRVVPNFVVQGGDPRGDMSGGPGYSIRDEMNRHLYDAGALGMALSGPDTGGSQFFVTLAPQPHLNGGYTVFGHLIDGAAVLRELLPGDEIFEVTRIQAAPGTR